METKLKSKAVHAGAWSFVDAFSMRIIQFVVGVILARKLLPEQFGLIGMLLIFTALAQTFLDSGFGAALIQKQKVSEKDINSVFYFNIVAGIVIVCCLYVFSPWIASFYNQPILTPLLRLLSLVIIINSFGMVQNVLLRKAIDFKTQTKVTFTASTLSGIIGISMAYLGWGVWSLVAQQIAKATFQTMLYWFFNDWRPSRTFSFQSLREMSHFGSRLLAAGLLNQFFENIYLLVIGKLFLPADLGFYTRANNLQKLPSTTLSSVVSRVTFPIFSTIQDDQERVKRGMKKVLTIFALINFPMMLGLSVVAPPLVLVLLTEKWAPCIPYFQLLCIIGLMYPLHLINLNVLQAMGRSDLFLKLEIIKKTLTVASIVITYRFGILAMISGQVIVSFVSYYLNAFYNRELIDYPITEQIHDIYPYFFISILMAIAVYLVTYISFNNQLALLSIQIIAGAIVYATLCHFFRLSAYIDLTNIIIGRFLHSKNV